jgi:hypothetical protein
MLEIVRDPFFLQQSADEVQIRFPILYAILPGCICAVQLFGVIVKSFLPENLLNDVDCGFLLKYPQIGRPGEQPQPGDHDSRVPGKNLAILARDGTVALGERFDNAVEEALLTVGKNDGNRNITADDAVKSNAVIVGEQGKLKVE